MDQKRTIEDIDGGDHARQGTLWSATAHIVTAVIGSGVLALAWSVAQLGWIAGPLALFGFSGVTYYTSTLLANSYRSPDPIIGERNRTYMEAVRSYLGPKEVFMCGVAQYVNLWGTMVGYTITATTSMMRSDCFHRNGHGARCEASGTVLMVVFGLIQVVLSQFPSLENITWLSVVAAVMSFAYSFIGLGLCIAQWASNGGIRGGLASSSAVSSSKRAWNSLLALGNIAFAYTFAEVLIEIQDTLKSPPPENKTMKKAAMYGIGVTTIFYLSLGCIGYAAFGDDAPGNILAGFGIYEPFWLIDVGNICLILHLVGAYQVYAQPVFATIERRIASQWPEAKFIHRTYTVRVPLMEGGPLSFTLSKLLLRSVFVLLTTLVAMLVPFFNAVLGLLGALSFWPLTVFFPVSMHIAQRGIGWGAPKWVLLQSLSMLCLLISVAASIGSVADIVDSLKLATPFKIVS
ncbi:amino acid permease 6-like isoform X2 [Phoenix dactylifera]|uniref:Amino acid permease 6-like isoform X2 n=1 Tax=Phoenix dactylifera TaxID=42345 RepID=A0A8B9ASM3_PHODC|nr:amino acid permease 6-like isoform X2 [Phoenix dactylifera]